jgi:hypothetical protein
MALKDEDEAPMPNNQNKLLLFFSAGHKVSTRK